MEQQLTGLAPIALQINAILFNLRSLAENGKQELYRLGYSLNGESEYKSNTEKIRPLINNLDRQANLALRNVGNMHVNEGLVNRLGGAVVGWHDGSEEGAKFTNTITQKLQYVVNLTKSLANINFDYGNWNQRASSVNQAMQLIASIKKLCGVGQKSNYHYGNY